MMFPYVFHMLWNTYIIRSHLALTIVTTHYYRCLTSVDILRTNWCVLLMYPLVVVLMYPSPLLLPRTLTRAVSLCVRVGGR